MSKLFQITEDDLAELERILPQWADYMASVGFANPEMQNRINRQVRQVQTVVMNVRWNYGPIVIQGCIPADDGPVTLPGGETMSQDDFFDSEEGLTEDGGDGTE